MSRPWTFLGGFCATLVALGLAGAWAGRANSHPGFTRFHQRISPEAFYYPTVSEMCSIVRRQCHPDSVLVIVGGNSINNGVGQPAGQVWTGQLQRELSNNFCVVNFALRGALMTDGGAIVAEVLRREYPRQIYVTNTGPLHGVDSIGIPTYRYLFWEAYFKGWLETWPPREARIKEHFGSQAGWSEKWVLRMSHTLDSAVHYRDFWNWIGYERFFTLLTPLTPELSRLLEPRKRLTDEEPDFRSLPVARRFGPEVEDHEMSIVRSFSESSYSMSPAGSWVPNEPFHRDFRALIDGAIPGDLKRRTLVVVSNNSPFFLAKLTPAERARDDMAYSDAVAIWRRAGYSAITYGKDFTEADFGDRTHLAVPGGRRLASQVAPEVKRMARELGYPTH